MKVYFTPKRGRLLSHHGEVPEFEVFAAEGAAANTSNSGLCLYSLSSYKRGQFPFMRLWYLLNKVGA